MSNSTIFVFLCFIAYAHCVFQGVCYKKPSACELKTNLALNLETEQNRMNARCKALQALNDTEKFYNVEVSNGLKKCEGKNWENVEKIKDELKKIGEECENEKEEKEIETNNKLVSTDETKKEESKNDMEQKKIETPKKERTKKQARQHYAWIVAPPQNEVKKEDWRTEEQKKELAERKAKSPSKQFYAWVIRDEPKKQDKEKDMEQKRKEIPVCVEATNMNLQFKEKYTKELEKCETEQALRFRHNPFANYICKSRAQKAAKPISDALEKATIECDIALGIDKRTEAEKLEYEYEQKKKQIPVCIEVAKKTEQLKKEQKRIYRDCKIIKNQAELRRFQPKVIVFNTCEKKSLEDTEYISIPLKETSLECDIALGITTRTEIDLKKKRKEIYDECLNNKIYVPFGPVRNFKAECEEKSKQEAGL